MACETAWYQCGLGKVEVVGLLAGSPFFFAIYICVDIAIWSNDMRCWRHNDISQHRYFRQVWEKQGMIC